MSRNKNQNAQVTDFIACAMAGDITEFPDLIDGLHKAIGASWGHLPILDGPAFLAHSEGLHFIVLALDTDDLTECAAVQDILRRAHQRRTPVILVTDLPAAALAQIVPADLAPAARMTPAACRAGLERAVVDLTHSNWAPPEAAPAAPGRVTMLQSLASGCGAHRLSRALAETLSAGGDPVTFVRFSDDASDPVETLPLAAGHGLTEVQLPHAGGAGMARHLHRVVTDCAAQGSHVVVDLPPVMIPAAAQLVPLADTYFAVAEITPRVAQNTRALRRVMAEAGRSLQDIRFVLNRLGSDARSLRRKRDMAAALCIDFAHVMPDARLLSDTASLPQNGPMRAALTAIAAETLRASQRGSRAA